MSATYNFNSNIYVPGSATCQSFVRVNGTSLQFLKGDGSIDTTVYAAISGATFSGAVLAPNLNISNWNTAYGWGDHAGEYMLQGPDASGDLNNIKERGSYKVDNSATNVPTSGAFWTLLVSGNNSNAVSQTAIHFQTGVSYIRAYNTSWSNWRQSWDSVNLSKSEFATAAQGLLAVSASQATGVENNADVTDTSNVTAAGALMDSEVTNLQQVKDFDSSDYAVASHQHSASEITSGTIAAARLSGNYSINAATATALRTARTINGVSFNGTANITIQDNTKEVAFSKNTAFNKDFGATSGTVAEGNDSRVLNGQTAYEAKINTVAITGSAVKTVTLTRQDGSTISDTFNDNNTETDIFLNGLVFNSTNGVFTATLNDSTSDTVSLDGRWSLLNHTHEFSEINATPTTLSGYGITDSATAAQGVLADNSVQKTGQTTQTVNGTLIASTMLGGIGNDYTSVSFLGIEMSRVESYIRPVTDLGGRLFIGKELRRFTNIDIYSNGVFSINENLIWHAGNDGVGSDLDAGLLGGQLPAFYAADSNVVKKTGETSQSIDGNLRTGSIYINEGNVALGDGLLLENVAGKLNWDGGQLVNIKYIASRGENLITNYSGLLGTNYNFSSFTFDGVETNSSPGSFRHTSASTEFISTNEFMTINASNRYRMSVDAKSLNGVGRYYMMTIAYDVDGIIISAIHHMYRANTATTLAVALNPGDTTVTLASNGANYNNTGTADVSPHLRSLIFWEYTNSLGYTYPVETYSRLYYTNQWDPGSISGNVITLRTPWAGPAYPVGSRLSNGNSGNSYKYNVLSNNTITTNWVTYTGYMDGVDYSGTNVTNKFPPGTASIRMGWLMNFQGNASETTWFTNFFVGKDTRATDISSGVFNIDRIPTGTGGAVLDSDSRLSDIRIDPSKLPLTGGTLTGALRLKSSWSTSFLQSNSVYAESGINGFAFGLGTGVSSWFSKGGSTVNRAIDVWNDNSKIVLGSSGANVGIKNTNPTEALDVTGNVKAINFIGTLTGTASNANTLGDQLPDFYDFRNFGLGEQKVSTETNLDNYTASGFYLTPSSGLTNLPVGAINGRCLITVNGGVTYQSQFLVDSSGQTFTRKGQGVNFTPWLQHKDSGEFATEAQGVLADNSVQKSGAGQTVSANTSFTGILDIASNSSGNNGFRKIISFPSGGYARNVVQGINNISLDDPFNIGIFGNGTVYSYAYIGFNLSHASTNNMTISPSGNIGLGITVATEKIEVVGNVKATSFIGNVTGNLTGNANTTSKLLTTHQNIAVDLDDVPNGVIYNYDDVGHWANGPSGMSHGSVFSLGSNSNGSKGLSTQLAVDVNNNSSSAATKDFWFRTANNLGFSNDWKKLWHSGNLDTNDFLQNVVEDTSPQLGGNLLMNSNDITGTGNVNISGSAFFTKSEGMIGLIGDESFNTKYLQLRNGIGYGLRMGIQATDNIATGGAGLITSSKVIAFKSNTTTDFNSIEKTDLIIKNSKVGIGDILEPIYNLHVARNDGTFQVAMFETNKGGALIRHKDTTASVETGIQGGLWVAKTDNTIRMHIDTVGTVTATGAIVAQTIRKSGQTDASFLLAGGGHVAINSYVLTSEFKVQQHDKGDRRQINVFAEGNAGLLVDTNSIFAGDHTIILDKDATIDLNINFVTFDWVRGDIISIVNRSTAEKINLETLSLATGTISGDEEIRFLNGSTGNVVGANEKVRLQRWFDEEADTWCWYEIE